MASESAKSPPEATYSSDQPIETKNDDLFNRWPFANRIGETIVARKDLGSLVIGIYGVWGDGKTSALNLLKASLRPHDDVVIVDFNPWHFESQSQLIGSFFKTLADALGKSLATKKEEIGNILKRYGSLLSVASIGVLGGAVTLSPGSAATSIGESLSTVELGELRNRLEKLLAEADKRLVIVVDDIDRLDRKEIQAVFKLVKLSASFDRTVYVLAFDDELVAGALAEQYGSGSPEAGRQFLEKIIQVPLRLPPADDIALRRLCLEVVDTALRLADIALSESQVQEFVRPFVDGLVLRMTTPRQAKRYGNALTFALPIMRGEVNPVDQMLIEGLGIFYPALYACVRDNPAVFLGTQSFGTPSQAETDERRSTVEQGLRGLTPIEAKAAKRFVATLFPRAKGLFGNVHYGSDWDGTWEREQRVCASHYFPRYFRYAVPPNDIPDLQLDALLSGLSSSNRDAVADSLRLYAERNAMPRLIQKLRRRAESIPSDAAEVLAQAIAKLGGVLPREEGPFVFGGTFMQGAILVRDLIERMTTGENRVDLACSVLQEAEPLPFAAECFRWMRGDTKQPEEEWLLTADSIQKCGEIVAARIEKVASEKPLFETYGTDSPGLFWLWQQYGEKEKVRAVLAIQITDVNSALSLIGSYVGKAWGLESGRSHQADFQREAYDLIAGLVEPERILALLRLRYGASLGEAEFYGEGMESDQRIAHQYAWMHRKVTDSQREQMPSAQASSEDHTTNRAEET